MSEARMVIGDSLSVLRQLPAGSADVVMTSPPFLALRSYLPADHPDKAHEIGQEGTPGAFIDALLDVVEECRRVLAPHGSIAIELGDTYSGSGGAGGDYGDQGLRAGQPKFEGSGRRNRPADVAAGILAPTRRPGPEGRDRIPGWPLAKSLCLIPELFRVALVYGFNPLTGRTTPQWRARNVVRWCRPNPPVGDLGDKVRPATSEMVVCCVSAKRWFDLDAVRGPGSPNTHARTARGVESRPSTGKSADDERRGGNFSTLATLHDTNGAPPLDWWRPLPEEQEMWDAWADQMWEIPTHGYPGAHYATYPAALCVRPIQAMCPREVCRACGTPRRRIVESESLGLGHRMTRAPGHERALTSTFAPDVRTSTTLGWTDCGCGAGWRPGVVLDPFGGSGTTAAVATGNSRDCLLIDLDRRNLDLAQGRVGMWLSEATAPEAAAWLDRTPKEARSA